MGGHAELSEIQTKQSSFLQDYVDLAQPRKNSFLFILKLLWSTLYILVICDGKYMRCSCPHLWSLIFWGAVCCCLLTLRPVIEQPNA